MFLSYKLKNGEYVRVYAYDVLDDLELTGKINAYIYDNSNEVVKSTFIIKPLLDEENRPYFMAFSQKVYFSDYEAYTVEELSGKIKNQELITLDEMAATFMRYQDKIAFVEPRMADGSIKTVKVLCALVEDKYSQKDWAYMIETIPVNPEEDVLYGYGIKEYKLSDYYNLLRQGKVEMVIKENVDTKESTSKPFVRIYTKKD